MNVRRLMEILAECDPEAEVLAMDPEEGDWAPVTGTVSDMDTVSLYTDEP